MKKFKIFVMSILVFIFSLICSNEVKGASASISSSSKEVTVGTKVTISANGTAAAWNVYIEGEGVNRKAIVGNSEDALNKNFSGSTTFISSKVGPHTITLSGSVTDEKNIESTPIKKSIVINVKAKEQPQPKPQPQPTPESKPQPQPQPKPEPKAKSNNASLSNLGIRPNDFNGFTQNKTSYSVEVPNSVSSVEIYAYKAIGQNGQKISGTGTKKLKEGTNSFSVSVLAEDGKTKKTYNLNIKRKTKEENEKEENEKETETEDKIEEVPEKKENVTLATGLKDIKIEGVTLTPQFSENIFEYEGKYIGENTSLDIQTTAKDEKSKIEIIGNKELKKGKNIITIIVTNEEKKESVTYQITINKSLVDEEAIKKDKEIEQRYKTKKRILIITLLVIAIIIVATILIIRIRKNSKIYDENEDEDLGLYNNEDLNYDDEHEEEINEKKSNKKRGKRFK